MSALAALRGARVRRIDAPTDGLLALSLAAGDQRPVLLLSLRARSPLLGLCDQRPASALRNELVRRLKRALEGTRLCSLTLLEGDCACLRFERGEGGYELVAGGRGTRDEVSLWDAHATLLASTPDGPDEDARSALRARALGAPELALSLSELHAAGTHMLQAHAQALHTQRRDEISRALERASRLLQRRLAAVEADLARAEQVERLRRDAGLLLSNLHAIPAGARELSLLDPSHDPPRAVELAIDPRLGPSGQAEAWFRRARKLERGARLAAERARTTREAVAALSALRARPARAPDAEALEAVGAEARAQGVTLALPPAAQPARAKARAIRLPYRTFMGSGEREIRVGRGAADNDALTLHHSKPYDLWLHARDDAGAHVVVPLARDEACPPELLCDAATLAAHFSQARGQTRVDVTYVTRRYVRKPRKAAAGLVTLQREKVFRLQLEPARLRRLLASERNVLG